MASLLPTPMTYNPNNPVYIANNTNQQMVVPGQFNTSMASTRGGLLPIPVQMTMHPTILGRPSTVPLQPPAMVQNIPQPPASYPCEDGDMEVPDEVIMNALSNPKSRIFLLKLDLDLENFMKDQSINRLIFPPMTSYNRMIVHKIASYYRLVHLPIDIDAASKSVVVLKKEDSKIPVLRLSDLMQVEEESENKTFKILKRSWKGKLRRSSAEERIPDDSESNKCNDIKAANTIVGISPRSASLPSSVPEGSSPEKDDDLKSPKSLEQREEEYAKIREKIFGVNSVEDSDDGLDNEDAIYQNSLNRATYPSTVGFSNNDNNKYKDTGAAPNSNSINKYLSSGKRNTCPVNNYASNNSANSNYNNIVHNYNYNYNVSAQPFTPTGSAPINMPIKYHKNSSNNNNSNSSSNSSSSSVSNSNSNSNNNNHTGSSNNNNSNNNSTNLSNSANKLNYNGSGSNDLAQYRGRYSKQAKYPLQINPGSNSSGASTNSGMGRGNVPRDNAPPATAQNVPLYQQSYGSGYQRSLSETYSAGYVHPYQFPPVPPPPYAQYNNYLYFNQANAPHYGYYNTPPTPSPAVSAFIGEDASMTYANPMVHHQLHSIAPASISQPIPQGHTGLKPAKAQKSASADGVAFFTPPRTSSPSNVSGDSPPMMKQAVSADFFSHILEIKFEDGLEIGVRYALIEKLKQRGGNIKVFDHGPIIAIFKNKKIAGKVKEEYAADNTFTLSYWNSAETYSEYNSNH